MMKQKLLTGLVLAAAAVAVVFTACNKSGSNCKGVEPTAEDAVMQAFMTKKGIVGTKTTQGIYYQITNSGSTSRPAYNSYIYCTYKGTLFNDSTFDQVTNPGLTGFQLAGLIESWKICIPLVGKGGSIKIVSPSKYAYGCTGSGDKIPANSPLYFEINVVDFY